jgi:hypothetical protein
VISWFSVCAFPLNLCRYTLGGKELVRVLMAGGSRPQTAATVALIGCMLTRDSAGAPYKCKLVDP